MFKDSWVEAWDKFSVWAYKYRKHTWWWAMVVALCIIIPIPFPYFLIVSAGQIAFGIACIFGERRGVVIESERRNAEVRRKVEEAMVPAETPDSWEKNPW